MDDNNKQSLNIYYHFGTVVSVNLILCPVVHSLAQPWICCGHSPVVLLRAGILLCVTSLLEQWGRRPAGPGCTSPPLSWLVALQILLGKCRPRAELSCA